MKNRIKELRTSKKISQEVLADYLGIAQNTLSYWENGKFDVDTESLGKLADYFDCTTDYILYRDDVPKRPKFEGLSYEELFEVTKYSEINPYIFLQKYTGADKFILFGLDQSEFMKKSAELGYYFNCWGPTEFVDLFKAVIDIFNKPVPPQDSFITEYFEVGFVKLPPSIISVRKNEGEHSYVAINANAFKRPKNPEEAAKIALGFVKPIFTESKKNNTLRMVPQDSPAQDPATLVAFGGVNDTVVPNGTYQERKALQRKIDENDDNQ